MDKLIIDKLYERVEERGVVCLGLDTDASYIPQHILEGKSLDEIIAITNLDKHYLKSLLSKIKSSIVSELDDQRFPYIKTINIRKYGGATLWTNLY